MMPDSSALRRVCPIALTAAACLLIAATAVAQERGTIERDHGDYVELIERVIPVSPGGTLELATDYGAVDIDSWERDEVKVVVEKRTDAYSEEDAQKDFDRFEVTIRTRESDVRVRGEEQRRHRRGDFNVHYTITVPSRYNVEASTAGGHIEVGDLEGYAELETAGGHIAIGRVTGNSVQATTAGGHIELKEVADGDAILSTAGGHIAVGHVSGVLRAETAGGHIEIRRGGGEVDAKTSGGSIEVDAADGDIDVATSGGSIEIGRIEGDVEAATSGGSIEVGVCRGSVEVATSGGSIRIDGSGGPIRAETSGGSIDIEGARGAVLASTSGGDIEVEMIADAQSRDLRSKLETGGGDITLRIADDLPVTIEAELYVSRRYRGDYRIYSDFPLAIRGEDTREISADGDLNGGGDLIRLLAEDGDIRILAARRR